MKSWRCYLKDVLGKQNCEFEFYIGKENYIQVLFNDYVKIYKSKLPYIINMNKKFDPLFLNPAIINGNTSIFKFRSIRSTDTIDNREGEFNLIAVPLDSNLKDYQIM